MRMPECFPVDSTAGIIPLNAKQGPYLPFSPPFVQSVLKDNGLWLSRNRGQNYLVDRNIAAKIIDLVPPDLPVFEVGSGLGALTHLLLQRQELFAIEIDKGICELLLKLVPALQGHLHHADFLEMDLDHLPQPAYVLVSNLPYSISGEALRLFIDNDHFSSAILMLQKEFVQRISAAPGSSLYSPLAVLSQSYLRIEPQFSVSRTAFFPAPSVDSMVIRANKRDCSLPQKAFRHFLLQGFLSRRKTLLNNLKRVGFNAAHLESLSLSPGLRPQDIAPPQWQALFQLYLSLQEATSDI